MTKIRRHPEAKVGDRFGPFTVTATKLRGHRGRSDERVEWRCVCGRFGVSYVFNLRKAKDAFDGARRRASCPTPCRAIWSSRKGCECPKRAPARDRCDIDWIRCNGVLRVIHERMAKLGPEPGTRS